MALQERLERVRALVDSAARSAGRDPASVRLVGVSKGHGPEAVEAAVAAGLTELGENYVQEWQRKAEATRELPVRWHFVGALQRNKAKALVGEVELIHSVDRLGLAQHIARLAEARGALQEILLQVNIGREPQKAGVLPEVALQLYAQVAELPGLLVRGIMVIPPATPQIRETRPHFEHAAKLLSAMQELGAGPRPTELSMGMSADFELAIACGATIVRVGTAIFGPRR